MSGLEEVAGWKMSELKNDEVGKCRSWLMSGWQASELDFDVEHDCTPCHSISMILLPSINPFALSMFNDLTIYL